MQTDTVSAIIPKHNSDSETHNTCSDEAPYTTYILISKT